MFRTSWLLAPLAAALVLGLTAGRSVAQPAVIIGPPTVVPIYTAPSPNAYVAPPTVYAAPAPVIAYPTPLPPVITSYYAPAAPVVAYSTTTVIVRRPRVVRYYYPYSVSVYP